MEFVKYNAPLSGEIKGIDLNNFLSIETKKNIKKFVDDNLVALIRNQNINDHKLKDQTALRRVF